MSSYLTPQEFFDLGIKSGPLKALAPSAITNGILAASDVVDSYLRKRYTLPLVTFGSDIKLATAKICQYELMSNHGYRPDQGAEVTIENRYNQALSWLTQVSKGDVEPNVTDSTPNPPGEIDGTISAASAPATNFNMNTGRGGNSGCCGSGGRWP